MTIAYIRKTYNVPARRGGRIEYCGGKKPELGTITVARGAYLLIRLDGQKASFPYHPTWSIRYLDGVPA